MWNKRFQGRSSKLHAALSFIYIYLYIKLFKVDGCERAMEFV